MTATLMPPISRLSHPTQDLSSPFTDESAPPSANWRFDISILRWRIAVFVPTLLMSLGLLLLMLRWFQDDGYNIVEIFLLVLITFNFFWITLTVSTVLCGLVSLLRRKDPSIISPTISESEGSLSVALLLPIYNEVPWNVLGNACAILQELSSQSSGHEYTMFVLSDTGEDSIASQELDAIDSLRAEFGLSDRLYYRRRPTNTDHKVGNIADWVANWGGSYSAMLVLDADSLMSGSAIRHLSDALSDDPSAGLIQSFPQLIGARTLFARVQQFANGVYGAVLAQGMACWSGREGNYWGHNAILRTRAFAQCAGLPKIRSMRRGERLIMSHDFVEASLLRRAGWSVKFSSNIKGSYEETPATLIDHIIRDRRWCHGNLQHLRLLATRGFHPISRFHLFHGAVSYLLSPLWFCLLLVWALVGNGPQNSILTYFSEENPLFPTWPQMGHGWHLLVLLLTYSMLLAPKFLGVASLPAFGVRLKDLGGTFRFTFSFLLEILLSIAYAPILMIQQMLSVLRIALGKRTDWSPQSRYGESYSLFTHLRYHLLETLSGIALLLGIYYGVVTIWLLPISLSLSLSIGLSILSGLPVGNDKLFSLTTPEVTNEPAIMKTARDWRRRVKQHVEGGGF